MKKLLLSGIMALLTVGAYAKEIRTVVVTTDPEIECINCENKIKNELKFTKGVKRIEIDRPAQQVTITYDADKTSVEKLAASFAKIGYKVSIVKESSDKK